MEALILDENFVQVPLGTPGELPSVASRWLQDAERNSPLICCPVWTRKTYYRTGDRGGPPTEATVVRAVDSQIKCWGIASNWVK
jgi:hypothetical protein